MDGLYVSAFVGGIKKKFSPTLAFETQIMEHSVFDQNCFSIFLLKLTTKVLKECFEQNRIECQANPDSELLGNSNSEPNIYFE